jgi:hypothetical protein
MAFMARRDDDDPREERRSRRDDDDPREERRRWRRGVTQDLETAEELFLAFSEGGEEGYRRTRRDLLPRNSALAEFHGSLIRLVYRKIFFGEGQKSGPPQKKSAIAEAFEMIKGGSG